MNGGKFAGYWNFTFSYNLTGHYVIISVACRWYLSLHLWEDPCDGATLSDAEADAAF